MIGWRRYARAFDELRVIPRGCLLLYGWMSWDVARWFESLPDPGGPQSAFVGVVFGVIPLILNFYMANGTDWTKHDGPSQAPPVH